MNYKFDSFDQRIFLFELNLVFLSNNLKSLLNE